MKKMMLVITLFFSSFLLTNCPLLDLFPPDLEGYEVDHSVCNDSAVEIQFGDTNTMLRSLSLSTSSTAHINACYGVGGKAHYYGASAFIYERSEIDSQGNYTYYLVTSNTGILHRFKNEKNIEDNFLQEKNVTTLSDGIYELTFDNGQRYRATYLGRFDEADIAVFTFKSALDLPLSPIGSSDSLQVGDKVYAVGTPIFGNSLINTVVQGYVSGLNRRYAYTFVDAYDYRLSLQVTDHPAFQFDAPINGGMEGGSVLDEDGNLVGIIAYQYEEDVESLSLAIPIDDVKNIINTIITSENHEFIKITLGVAVVELESIPGNGIYGVNEHVTQGLYIDSVTANSNASKAGVRAGEIITGLKIGGVSYQITNIASLSGKLWRCNVGDEITIMTKSASSELSPTIIVSKTYEVTILS